LGGVAIATALLQKPGRRRLRVGSERRLEHVDERALPVTAQPMEDSHHLFRSKPGQAVAEKALEEADRIGVRDDLAEERLPSCPWGIRNVIHRCDSGDPVLAPILAQRAAS